ncbi:MAG: argininosuccinate synthase, partial [Victivallales bacterium]|nr:argininosuccinate synthase [Victivallales bacterium]
MKKVVVAYSGGLDTSVIVRWLIEKYNVEVIGFCADIGQGEELDGLEEKAIKTGASKCYVEDLREEFVKDYVFPMAKSNAIYEGTYLLGTAIARPLIAKRLVEIANKEGADTICHGATGKGNDQVRFELTAYALDPNINVIAPWRVWEFKGRTDLIEYATKYNIPVTSTHEKPYSMDRNLLHISFEGGMLENPWHEAPDTLGRLTTPLGDTPNKPEYIG